MDISGWTHAGMAPRFVPNAFSRIIGDHDWVNIFGRSEILAGPIHVAELLLGRVVGVDICALPASHEFFGRNGFKLVKNGEVLFFCDVLASDELHVLFFGRAMDKVLAGIPASLFKTRIANIHSHFVFVWVVLQI